MGKKWQKVKFKDVKSGDVVRIVRTEGETTNIVEGPIGVSDGSGAWDVDNHGEWFFPDEFGKGKAKLYRKVAPFEFPTKLGAVFVGKSVSGVKSDATFIYTGGAGWKAYLHREGGVFYSKSEVERFFDSFGPYKEESE